MNMEVQAFIQIHEDGSGNFQFGLVAGQMNGGIVEGNDGTRIEIHDRRKMGLFDGRTKEEWLIKLEIMRKNLKLVKRRTYGEIEERNAPNT